MEKVRVGILVGSARRGSFTQAVARSLVPMMPENWEAQWLALEELPFYCEDYDNDGAVPPLVAAFRKQVRDCRAFLFLTPEYNRSVPSLLKNALDTASRPYGQNAWSARPAAVIGVSPGQLGAFGACSHLRQSLTCLNAYVMQQPEAYLANAATLFDGQGNLLNEDTQAFLRHFMKRFAAWVARFA